MGNAVCLYAKEMPRLPRRSIKANIYHTWSLINCSIKDEHIAKLFHYLKLKVETVKNCLGVYKCFHECTVLIANYNIIFIPPPANATFPDKPEHLWGSLFLQVPG